MLNSFFCLWTGSFLQAYIRRYCQLHRFTQNWRSSRKNQGGIDTLYQSGSLIESVFFLAIKTLFDMK